MSARRILSGHIAPAAWAAFLLLAVMAGHALADPAVVRVSGKAEMRSNAGASWKKLQSGTSLPAGASVRTPAGSSVTVRDDAARVTVTVGPNTELGYEGQAPAPEGSQSPASDKPVPTYSLPAGKAEVSVEPGNNVDLLTPLILTSVRGTRYTASVKGDGSTHVAVKTGIVLTLDKFGNRARLSGGQEQSMTALEYIERLRAMPNLRKIRGGGSGRGWGNRGSAGSGAGSGGGDDGGGDDGGGDDGGDD